MSTQVYYRKWRPQRLDDLVGQEPITRTLKHAIVRNRIAHAYLFCGPRGTGKTSTARILAKAANCLSPQDGEPCNQCHLCVAVNEGQALDLVEIDAASNRGIDEIRSIREKVRYAPAEGKYKVYVLDEAHMLTDAAADALLKTLEEPPAHVIFILATTEPHRLTGTIVSRCQRFDFRRIEPEAMAERLAAICAAEGIQAEPAALHAITRNAAGSLRDAENLLEQAATSFGSPLGLEQVRLLMGLTADDRVRLLVGHILQGKTTEALITLHGISSEGLNLRQLHRQMVDELRELLLLKSGAREMVVQPEEVVKEQQELVAQIPLERILGALRLLGHVNFRHDAPPTLPLELAIIDAAQAKGSVQEPAVAAKVPAPVPGAASRPAPASTPAAPQPTGQAGPSSYPQPPSVPSRPRVQAPPAAAEVPAGPRSGDGTAGRLEEEWDGIVKSLSRYKGRRYNLGALLRGCRQRRLEGDTLSLEFTHESHMDRMKEEMDNPESRRTFLDVVTSAAGISTPLNLVITTANGVQGADRTRQSPLLQAALGMGGKIIDQNEEGDEQEHDTSGPTATAAVDEGPGGP